ncbi:stage II sporulation protein R [Mechercharimyces sp. CAU 1602]|uniref:stage II sporulation protein R n=1 Tax=Mechercharimyces sp. CAU 1602 TaxID=2973933 RepID=UPI002162B8DF|nr:stage II sporulation protein R [Mechercharimyces sp. CAU 1602]MCS1352313.1 stage II sporulation protein R [Mechercharimyces sp. CAU 1602]
MRIRTYTFLLMIAALVSGFLYLTNGEDAVVAATTFQENDTAIPEESIRLRILANSDTVQDQALKQKVRDAVLEEMGGWVNQPNTLVEARSLVKDHIPTFEGLAAKIVKQHGYDYEVDVDFGQVPFPTKMYGNRVYPAGEYEALRITIGEGEGDNWWCVLFPPLCFVDMSNGDAVSEDEKISQATAMVAEAEALANPVTRTVTTSTKDKPVEVRFFFVDSLKEFFTGLFK